MPERSLTLTVEHLGPRALVVLPDLVDAASQRSVGEQVLAALDASGGSLIIDMSDVTFIDSAGLGVLISAHRRARESGAGLAVVAEHPIVLYMLEIAGADQLFTVYPSVHDALYNDPAADPAADRPRAVRPAR
ncbi:anti-sigma B factor antagonist [Murinocardiopsis flavida]|uniref:Anti-sigma factor antagonist n=1 Tax=Murinocardiopsis flavida TaxID=645275 RepID=A0A2P8D999_9ACTN|nr:STAS domain-containing protein [Murinocardiopsis flavida]PSK93800.1 anti-sigma B factor antagonist [Murinocardiopsis flavida]